MKLLKWKIWFNWNWYNRIFFIKIVPFFNYKKIVLVNKFNFFLDFLKIYLFYLRVFAFHICVYVPLSTYLLSLKHFYMNDTNTHSWFLWNVHYIYRILIYPRVNWWCTTKTYTMFCCSHLVFYFISSSFFFYLNIGVFILFHFLLNFLIACASVFRCLRTGYK